MSKLAYYDYRTLKPVNWFGRSLEQLRLCPKPIQEDIGRELRKVQKGGEPSDWKPVNVVGKGVKEIRSSDETGQYRLVYIAKFQEAVYVLHMITRKKTRQTSGHDIKLATVRFKALIRWRKVMGYE